MAYIVKNLLLVLLGIPACPASKEPRGSPQLNLTTDAPVSYCFNIHDKNRHAWRF